MGMRNYQPIHISPMLDPSHRNELLKIDKFLRQISANQARVPQAPQGTPSAGSPSVDLSNYLFLPGRPLPGQFAKERVTFDMKSGDEISSTNDSAIRGLTLRHTAASGGVYYNHDVYFSAEGTGANIARRWIFPNFSAGASDNRVFVAASGSQELSGKTLVGGTIHVGSNASRNIFRDTTSGTKEFIITTASGFPTTAMQTPTLQLPALDTSTNEHSFVMLHSNQSAPFPAGSILYGNAAGTEMAALTNGTAGQLLVSGGTTVAPSWGSTGLGGDFLDSTFRVVDDGDPTKKLEFQVSGVTTATTRTWTVPDFDGTPALFRSNKLRIGDTTAPTHHLEIVAGTTSIAPIRLTTGPLTTAAQSGAIEFATGNFYATNTSGTRGRIMVAITQPLNQRVPFAFSTNLTYTHDANFVYDSVNGILSAKTFNATRVVYDPLLPDYAIKMPTGKAILGTSTDDSYSHVIQADKTIVDDPIGNVATFFAIMRANPAIDSTSNYLGFDGGCEVKGSANLLSGGAGFGAVGLRGVVENENSATTDSASSLNALYYTKSGHGTTSNVYGFSNRWVHQFGTITNAYGAFIECDVRALGGACTNSYGLYISDTTQGGTTLNYALFSLNGPAVFGGKLKVGATTVPTQTFEVTGTALVSSLTAGRVTFAGTGGLLTDDADMTFVTDTLTVTKIAATTLTGLLTFADAINVAVNATTGTKIGTAASQKLGVWNAAPIVQPTTAGAAATFVTNTSLIANDSATFDGYTIGQVVKALRNIGLLA